MIARIGLIVAGIVVWVGLGLAMMQMAAAPATDRITAAGRASLAANHSRLALAAEHAFASRLPEVETLSGILALGKTLEAKKGAAKEAANALANRTQAAIGTLPGAPLYAVVGGNGSVVAATLWPEEAVVRAEPAVAAALAGVSRLSVWRKDNQPFVLAAAPVLGSDGTPVGALVIARPLGKELCDEIAQGSGVKLFALSVVPDKITCAGGAEAVALPALKPGTQSLVAQTLSDPPMFVAEDHIGTLVEARPFRSELPGSSLIAGQDLKPELVALHEHQVRVATLHVALLVPIALFVFLFALVLGQSAGRMANHLSMVLQQGEKAGMLDEHHYTGRMRRLAKNVNGLLLRAPVKAPNDKISLMLGTVDEPPEDAHEMPLTPPAQAAETPAKPTPPEAAPFAPFPTTASPKQNAQPNPLASPFDSNELSNAFDSSFDGDFDPTRIAAAPEAPRPAAPLPTSASADGMLKSKSLGSQSLFDEEFRFGDNTPVAPAAAPAPKSGAPANDFSDSETDAALGDLPGWPAQPAAVATAAIPALPALPEEPPAAPGATPWESTPALGSAINPADPDAVHFQETYDQFVKTRAQCNESGELPLAKFIDKLKKSREQVMQRQNCQKVRFQVYVKDGKAALKAVAFR